MRMTPPYTSKDPHPIWTRQAFGAKINWHKLAAIWASKKEKTWSWGEEVGLRWVLEGEGTHYLGI